MILASNIVTLIYYLLVAWIVFVLVRNLMRARNWETEVLYVVVLVPFLLRLFRLK